MSNRTSTGRGKKQVVAEREVVESNEDLDDLYFSADDLMESDVPTVDVIADIGANSSKILVEGRDPLSIPSVISSVRMSRQDFEVTVLRAEQQLTIEIDGDKGLPQQWAVGEHAFKKRGEQLWRLEQKELGGNIQQIILATAMAYLLPPRAHVKLFTNIPIEYARSMDEFKLNMARTYRGRFGADRFFYVVDPAYIRVDPESKGVLRTYMLDDRGQPAFSFGDYPVLVVDAGGHTVNCGVYEGGRLDIGKSFTIDTGMVKGVFTRLCEYIEVQCGTRPKVAEVELAIRTKNGILHLGTSRIDLHEPEMLPRAYREIGHLIVNEITNQTNGGVSFSKLIGGGGLFPHIREVIEEQFSKHFLAPEKFPHVVDVPMWLMNLTGMRRNSLHLEKGSSIVPKRRRSE